MQNTAQFDGNIHARTPTTRTLGCGLHRPLPTPASSLRALTTIGRHRSTFLFWSVLLRILRSLRTQAGENVNCLRYPTTGCRLFVHQQAGYTACLPTDQETIVSLVFLSHVIFRPQPASIPPEQYPRFTTDLDLAYFHKNSTNFQFCTTRRSFQIRFIIASFTSLFPSIKNYPILSPYTRSTEHRQNVFFSSASTGGAVTYFIEPVVR